MLRQLSSSSMDLQSLVITKETRSRSLSRTFAFFVNRFVLSHPTSSVSVEPVESAKKFSSHEVRQCCVELKPKWTIREVAESVRHLASSSFFVQIDRFVSFQFKL